MSALRQQILERSKAEREDWRYTNLEKLLPADKPVQAPAPMAVCPALPSFADNKSQHAVLVFIDGEWAKEKSRLSGLVQAALQGDLSGGYQLKLAGAPQPVELVFVTSQGCDAALKFSVDVAAGSAAQIVEHHISSGDAPAPLMAMDIRVGEKARLMHQKIMHASDGNAHFAQVKAKVGQGGAYSSFLLVQHTRLLRQETEVLLQGIEAQCAVNGAMLLQGREHADILTRIRHMSPQCNSHQLFKVVVKDQARGVFQGRIAVAEQAQKTDAKQLCRALLLSDQAEMDAKPELEILADDVSCSHGCAIGDLDQDAMFYLCSRGLPEAEARALLLRAFVDEALDEIEHEAVRAYMRGLAEGWMNEQA